MTGIETTGGQLACRLPDEKQDRQWEDVASEVYAAVEDTRELEDGYAFRFPSPVEWARTLAEYVLYERECCPFFRFELMLEPDAGPTWLRMRGGEDVKRFVREQLRDRVEWRTRPGCTPGRRTETALRSVSLNQSFDQTTPPPPTDVHR